MLSTMRVGGLAQRAVVAPSTNSPTVAASPSAAFPRKISRVSLATATSVVGGRPLLRAGAYGAAKYERKPQRAIVRKGASLTTSLTSERRNVDTWLRWLTISSAVLATFNVQ